MISLRLTAFLVSLSALLAFAPAPAFAGKGRSSNKPKKAQFSAQYFPTECEFASRCEHFLHPGAGLPALARGR
jgi:hypothetical protein